MNRKWLSCRCWNHLCFISSWLYYAIINLYLKILAKPDVSSNTTIECAQFINGTINTRPNDSNDSSFCWSRNSSSITVCFNDIFFSLVHEFSLKFLLRINIWFQKHCFHCKLKLQVGSEKNSITCKKCRVQPKTICCCYYENQGTSYYSTYI